MGTDEAQKKEQEEREKEQRRGEIGNEVTSNSNEIKNLKAKKTAYENMKKEINKALPKLKSAQQNMSDSVSSLKDAYSGSNTSSNKRGKMKNLADDIGSIIKKIKSPILVEIDKKINSMNSQISTKENRIRELQNELNTLNHQ